VKDNLSYSCWSATSNGGLPLLPLVMLHGIKKYAGLPWLLPVRRPGNGAPLGHSAKQNSMHPTHVPPGLMRKGVKKIGRRRRKNRICPKYAAVVQVDPVLAAANDF